MWSPVVVSLLLAWLPSGQAQGGYDPLLALFGLPMAPSPGKSGYGYGYQEPVQQPSYGYMPMPQPSYDPYQDLSYSPPSYQPQPSYPQPSYPQPSYQPPSYPQPSYHPPSYPPPSYGQEQPKVIIKKVPEKIYVPVMVRKKKKKMKIISIQKGFYIPGGTQLFGKYKSLKSCEKACAATPNCFAGDYNPWLKKCYIHSNFTACATVRAHKKIIHFKKVPCSTLEAPQGLIMLGVQITKGIEQKGIKSLTDCIKKCATAGSGIPATVDDIADQLCFGIDYDFGSHKCYFHVVNTPPDPEGRLCLTNGDPPNVPMDTLPNPSVISITLCPGPP